MIIQKKPTEQYFPVVLFVTLCKAVSVEKNDHSNELLSSLNDSFSIFCKGIFRKICHQIWQSCFLQDKRL